MKEYIAGRKEWQEELALGKMFGVLVVVQETEGTMDKAKEKGTDEKKQDRLFSRLFRQFGRKEPSLLFRSSCL